jgi:hypothetical protein
LSYEDSNDEIAYYKGKLVVEKGRTGVWEKAKEKDLHGRRKRGIPKRAATK